MHPAYSVIFFTTASGAGYGLLALLGVLAPLGLVPVERWFGLAAFAVAFGLVTFGLLASTFHLGHPERAWRAFSQWRSSWLSREGVVATAAYVPAGLFALGWVVWESGWALAGFTTATLAALTVWCTAMIYASLKPIHAWHNGWVAPSYLALALATGALLLSALLHVFAAPSRLVAALALAALALAFMLKHAYWRFIDTTKGPSTVASATGLDGWGEVRLLEAPNTAENFVQREMGYRIARKHAAKLRRIAQILLFALPAALVLLGLALPLAPATLASLAALASAAAGVLIERWLFFAEARHAVTLYYGAQAA